MNLEGVRISVELAELGSLTQTGRQLGMGKSRVVVGAELPMPLGALHHRQLKRALTIEVEIADMQTERHLHPLVD
jgi:hypothetical protein